MPTTRSRPQVLINHLPGSLLYDDDLSCLGRVTSVDGPQDVSLDMNQLAEQVRLEIERWKNPPEGTGGNVTPDPGFVQPTDIEAIQPEAVEWERFPFYFRCGQSSCGVWQYKAEVLENEGRCKKCGQSGLEQTPYIWVHHCGFITPLVPGTARHCRRHGDRSLFFHDTRSFVTSSWRCRECSHQAPTGFQPCRQCASVDPRPQPMRWDDPGAFSSETFQMLNLPQATAEILLQAPRRDSALRGVVGSQIPPGSGAVMSFLDETAENCPQCETPVGAAAKFCPQCGASLPDRDASDDSGDSIEGEITGEAVALAQLWDMPGTESLRRNQGVGALESSGVADLLFVEHFPVSLVGLGFRRQLSKRPATLNLFPARNSSKAMAVFTNSTEVEALGLRLDAGAILKWLASNGKIAQEVVDDALEHDEMGKLSAIRSLAPDAMSAVSGLLHTASHAFIYGLSWCSGMDVTSFRELILQSVLTTFVHAGDSALGGLSSVFRQAPLQPLDMAAADLVACQLDPACSDHDGAACVACVFLPLGCAMWNSELSRAYLFGGKISESETIENGLWQL